MGERSHSYGQYCPISRALEVLGERWSLLIARDLVLGSTRFNDLARGLPGLSRSLLAKRLRQFERAGMVQRVDNEYLLTPAGRDLETIIFTLGKWGANWTFGDPNPEELDAQLLVWWMHDRLDVTRFPQPRRRYVFSIQFTDDRRRFWIVVENGVASVCLSDPGYEVDVAVCSDVRSLYQVWFGRIRLGDAIRAGRVTLDGPSSLVQAMPDVMQLSHMAPMVAPST